MCQISDIQLKLFLLSMCKLDVVIPKLFYYMILIFSSVEIASCY